MRNQSAQTALPEMPPNALKFNLSLAIAGEPVITRAGMPVTNLHTTQTGNYPLRAVVNGKEQSFTAAGTFWINRPDPNDLFLAGTAPIHSQDEDCAGKIDPQTLLCTECGVDHSEPCQNCGGRGFHRPTCADLV